MSPYPQQSTYPYLFKSILMAGVCAGFAEVFWISAYGYVTGVATEKIAWQILASFNPALPLNISVAMGGLLIHFLLSLVLSGFFILIVLPKLSTSIKRSPLFIAAILTLSCVWAVNYLFILPRLNPYFVTLLPLWVSYLSKAFYGLTLAYVLTYYKTKETA